MFFIHLIDEYGEEIEKLDTKLAILGNFLLCPNHSTEVTLNEIKFFCDFEYSETSILSAEFFYYFCKIYIYLLIAGYFLFKSIIIFFGWLSPSCSVNFP